MGFPNFDTRDDNRELEYSFRGRYCLPKLSELNPQTHALFVYYAGLGICVIEVVAYFSAFHLEIHRPGIIVSIPGDQERIVAVPEVQYALSTKWIKLLSITPNFCVISNI